MFTRLIINSDMGKTEVVCDIDCPWTVKIFFLHLFQAAKSILHSPLTVKVIMIKKSRVWETLHGLLQFLSRKSLFIITRELGISIQSINVISVISEEWPRKIAN